MADEQKYCVVAEDRETKNRRVLTSPALKEFAKAEMKNLNSSGWFKKHYRYFKVAKHPYKSKTKE